MAADGMDHRAEWRHGWPLVISASAGMAVSAINYYTMGLLIAPLQAEFGWSKAAITSGMTINAMVALALSPFIGALVDRIGPRRVGLAGVALFCLAVGSLATNGGSLIQWWSLWLFIAFGGLLVQPTIWVAAVASRFERARGLAVAATLCGSTVTAIVGPLLMGWAIENVGWRLAIVMMASIWGALVLPLLFFFFHGAIDLARSAPPASRPRRQEEPDVDARSVLYSPNFIKLVLASVLSYFVIMGSTINLAPMLMARGITQAEVTTLLSALGGGAFAGRLAAGYWLDRYSPKLFGCLIFGVPSIAFAILLNTDLTYAMALAVALIIGLASGAEMEVASFLTARYFGMRHFGMLLGTIVGLLVMVSGVAPLTFGHIYDQFGSYQPAIMIALPLSIMASLLILLLGQEPQAPEGQPVRL